MTLKKNAHAVVKCTSAEAEPPRVPLAEGKPPPLLHPTRMLEIPPLKIPAERTPKTATAHQNRFQLRWIRIGIEFKTIQAASRREWAL